MKRRRAVRPGVALRHRSAASTTQTWEMNGYQDFLRGRLTGLSITHDGRLIAGPALDTVFDSDQAEDLERRDRAGRIALSGHRQSRAIVSEWTPAGKSSLVWTADQPEIFAVAVDSQGRGLCRNVARRQGLSHRERQGHRILRPERALHLGAGGRSRRSADGRDRRPRQNLSGHRGRTGQRLLRNRPVARDRAGVRSRKDGCSRAASRTGFLSHRATTPARRSCCTNRACRKFARLFRGPDGSIYAAALGGGVAKRTGAASSATHLAQAGARRAVGQHHGHRHASRAGSILRPSRIAKAARSTRRPPW